MRYFSNEDSVMWIMKICKKGIALMEKDILNKLKMNNREEIVEFLKSLWSEKTKPCPLCAGKLDFLHKKVKKSNCDWICTVCGERYNSIKIFNQLNNK